MKAEKHRNLPLAIQIIAKHFYFLTLCKVNKAFSLEWHAFHFASAGTNVMKITKVSLTPNFTYVIPSLDNNPSM